MDLLSLALGLAIGVVAGGLAILGVRRIRKPREEKLSAPKPDSKVKSVADKEMENARKDLKTLLLEKELLAGALTRVYEAEVNGKITKDEREQIAIKYRDQLKAVEERLGDIELMIEVGELENLRTELLGLFERKMGQIENRLNDAKIKLDQIRGVKMTSEEAPIVEKVEEKKPERRKPKSVEAEVDKRVAAIRNEVLEALARLEQMDMEA